MDTAEKTQKKSGRKAPTKAELAAKRELAKTLFLQGEDQKAVAARVDVSQQTISRWAADGGWAQLRSAKEVSRAPLVTKTLLSIQQILDSGDLSPQSIDKLCKLASVIEKLDKKTSIVTYIDVFTAFSRWLAERMKIDSDLSPDTLRVITKYQDTFLSEQMSLYQK